MPQSTTSTTWPERMLDVLHDQQSIVQDLAGLASRQSDLIESNRTDALLTLLSERQQLIDRFTASQRRLTALSSENNGEGINEVDGEQRKRMQSLIDSISDRLAEVLQGDAQDQQRLEQSRDAVRTEITTIGRTAQARQAYGGAATKPNRFADRRG